ncbi:MAG: transmembrane 9 family protein, partial [bacterium]
FCFAIYCACVAALLPLRPPYPGLPCFAYFFCICSWQLYSLYGILSLVFLILRVVTCFITIALTYFQLAIGKPSQKPVVILQSKYIWR